MRKHSLAWRNAPQIAILGLVLALTFSCTAAEPAGTTAGAESVRIGDVLWFSNYDQALELARAANKALWMHFGENPG